ncbi:MAG: hypothetical protein COA38_08095 [Fluviicola sp.]|nr:MAG: hypothetical protein COA38_08095 [Fluviicola sp.]
MKRFLLSITILFLTLFCHAQELRIVKDNINCSYGIKDKNGNWVIQPIYTLIQQYNSGCFLVKDIPGDGILSPTGKWIVECKYDRIGTARPFWQLLSEHDVYRENSTFDKDFFLFGFLGERKMLLNSRGETLYDLSIHDRLEFDGNAHMRIIKPNTKTTAYLDTAGNIMFDDFHGEILLFGKRDFSLQGDEIRHHSDIMIGNVRLINRMGDTLLNEQFDQARLVGEDRIHFIRDSKFGIMDTSGKVHVAPNYRRSITIASREYSKTSWVVYNDSNKAGLMKKDGTIILEPKYDKLTFETGISDINHLWLAQKDGLTGVIDAEGKVLVPIEYENVRVVFDRRSSKGIIRTNFIVRKNQKFAYLFQDGPTVPKEWYDEIIPIVERRYGSGQRPILGHIVKRDGKYGVLNADGTVFLESNYDQMMKKGRYQNPCFFIRGLEVNEVSFEKDQIKQTAYTPFLKLKNKIIYFDSISYMLAELSANGSEIVSLNSLNINSDFYGNMYIAENSRSRPIVVYNWRTKKKLPLKNLQGITHESKDRYTIFTRNSHYGVVDENGKLIVDTLYSAIQIQRPYIWAAKQINENYTKWILLDSEGRKVVANLFDSPFDIDSGDELVTQKNKTGLLDTKTFRWKIRPDYPCLFQVAHGFYYMANVSNKKGVLRANGTILIRPVYDSLFLLTSNCASNHICGDKYDYEMRWVAYRGTTEILVDQNGNEVRSVARIRDFKKSLLFEDTLLLNQAIKFKNFPSLDYSPSLHFLRGLTPEQIRRKRAAMWVNPVLKEIVFDSIVARQQVPKGGQILGRTLVWAKGQNTTLELQAIRDCDCARSGSLKSTAGLTNSLISVGKNFVSIGANWQLTGGQVWGGYGYFNQQSSSANSFLNFVYQKGKAVPVELKDIFPSDSILMQEFVIALQKRDDLKLDCSSLEMMIELIDGKFSLSESGVHLYLNQQSTNVYGISQPVKLLIPRENLSKHSESSWIVPILTSI